MSAEDLARKHFDVDLTAADYWRDTLDMIEVRVEEFAEMTEELFP